MVTQLLGVGRRHFFARDRDALLLAALLSALLHFALLKSLMGYRTAPERTSGGNRDRSRALAAYRERDAASGKEPRVLAASNRAGKRCSSAARCGDVSSRTGARSAWQGLGSVSPDPVVTGLGRPAKPEDDRVAQTSRAANAPAAIVQPRGDPPDQSPIRPIRRRFRHRLCNRGHGSKGRRCHRSRRCVSRQGPMVQSRLRVPTVGR